MALTIAIITACTAAVTAIANCLSAMAETIPLLKESKHFAEADSLRKIKENMDKLLAIMSDRQKEVERQKTKVPSETFKDLINRVLKFKEELLALMDSYKKHKKKPSNRILKNLTTEVEDLIKEGDRIRNELWVPAPLKPVEKMKAPDFTNYETLEGKVDKILKLLENPLVKGVRVCGHKGVGKTAILKNLNNHEKVAELFDIVIWLKVSVDDKEKNLNIEHLQKSILTRLNVRLKGNISSGDVAIRISKELKNKEYLLLLDDVKEDLNLSDVICPDNENRCKIVLTTRQSHVCHNLVDQTVKVPYLSDDEAWNMFKDVLQCPSLLENPKISDLAWVICKQCGGIPLLIEKLSSTFKVKNDEKLWLNGLNSWRQWPKQNCQGIKEMFNFFKICYEDLDDAHKQCFLYGALYPEDIEIYEDYLLERWRAEDFLVYGQNYKKENETQNGGLIMSHLKNVALLEESEGGEHVSMHKFIRQVALNISSDDPCLYLVKTNNVLLEPMDTESWSKKRYISLSRNANFHKLPDDPESNELSTLFLQENSSLKDVPKSFFDQMGELRVLDFCGSGITLLPAESLSKLKSLKILCLSDCKSLGVLPLALENLACLEVLDISRSGIRGIPSYIDKLTSLRFLRVSLPENMDDATIMNTFTTISKLAKLEELVIDMEQNEPLSSKSVILSVIKNVATLKNFTALKFSIDRQIIDIIKITPSKFFVNVPDAEILHAFLEGICFYDRGKLLGHIRIYIDCDDSRTLRVPNYEKYPMYIKYFNERGKDLQLPEQFVNSEIAFELVAQKNIKELSDFNVVNSVNKITAFSVGSCEYIETIIGRVYSDMLSSIEHLYLDKLPELESIWKDPLQHLCLTKLRTLSLSGCPKLKKIFPHGVVQQLIHLQDFKIEDCSEIVEIFEEADTVRNPSHTNDHRVAIKFLCENIFSCYGMPRDIISDGGSHFCKPYVLMKLKKLEIIDMPKLVCISKEISLEWPSLVELEVSNCPRFKNLSIKRSNAPKLKRSVLNKLASADVQLL